MLITTWNYGYYKTSKLNQNKQFIIQHFGLVAITTLCYNSLAGAREPFQVEDPWVLLQKGWKSEDIINIESATSKHSPAKSYNHCHWKGLLRILTVMKFYLYAFLKQARQG